MKTKRCGKCKRELPLSEFNKDQKTKSGLSCRCKPCTAKNRRVRLERKNPGARKLLTYDQLHRTIQGVAEKLCTCCSAWKFLSEFGPDKRAKDGLRSRCNGCRREYNRTHKTKIAEYGKKYRQTHKIKIAERGKRYYQTIKGYLNVIFGGMVRRCNDPKVHNYENYGARGIEVRCTFPEFYRHITVTLGFDTVDKFKGLDIDRINTKGHYELGNLRIATQSQNCMNSRKPRTWHGRPCSSRFKGVSWNKQRKKWTVYIMTGGKFRILGYFPLDQERQAAEAYDQASLRYHGEFGATNESLGLFSDLDTEDQV